MFLFWIHLCVVKYVEENFTSQQMKFLFTPKLKHWKYHWLPTLECSRSKFQNNTKNLILKKCLKNLTNFSIFQKCFRKIDKIDYWKINRKIDFPGLTWIEKWCQFSIEKKIGITSQETSLLKCNLNIELIKNFLLWNFN